LAISKLSGNPFTNIRNWLFERDKEITPNPLKPFKKKTVTEKKINVANLANILNATHNSNGKINELVDEVNKIPPLEVRIQNLEFNLELLTQRLTDFETRYTQDINSIRGGIAGVSSRSTRNVRTLNTKSNIGHTHNIDQVETDGGEPAGHTHDVDGSITEPSTNRKGGKLQTGGTARTKPRTTSREDFKQMIIQDILNLQNNNG
jgi:hypothetical protein